MAVIVAICWLALAAIHAAPALALVRPALLMTLYHVEPSSPLYVLLHHRAALFAIVVGVATWAAADPAARLVASVVVGGSMAGFLVLYWRAGSPPPLRRIAVVDMAGLPFLGVAAWSAWAA